MKNLRYALILLPIIFSCRQGNQNKSQDNSSAKSGYFPSYSSSLISDLRGKFGDNSNTLFYSYLYNGGCIVNNNDGAKAEEPNNGCSFTLKNRYWTLEGDTLVGFAHKNIRLNQDGLRQFSGATFHSAENACGKDGSPIKNEPFCQSNSGGGVDQVQTTGTSPSIASINDYRAGTIFYITKNETGECVVPETMNLKDNSYGNDLKLDGSNSCKGANQGMFWEKVEENRSGITSWLKSLSATDFYMNGYTHINQAGDSPLLKSADFTYSTAQAFCDVAQSTIYSTPFCNRLRSNAQ